jgi:glycosyltransferase involved in cell wall biosynthesis
MSRKPRIAYLLKTYPKLSETFILNEILGLEKLGIDIEIFSLRRPADEPVHPSVAEVKAKVTYMPACLQIERRSTPPENCRVILAHLTVLCSHPYRYIRAAQFWQARQGKKWIRTFSRAVFLAAAMERGKFDHLHAHFANLPASVAEDVRRLCGISYSFTAHAKDIYLTEPAELKRKIESATCVLTCTAYNQRYLAALAPGATPIHLAYHGVEVGRFDSSGDPSHQARTVPLVLSVGRFCEKKGFPYLIRACRILLDRGYRFQCRIIGFGELESTLRALIAELDLADCVRISGKMTQDEVIAVYRKATLFVLPCLVTDDGDRDGIPNVLMEAMVSSIPVVSTRVSGITELVDHMADGILVAERDERGIADAMEMLLLQPELRQRLAQSGRAKVLSRFALEASARRVRDILLHAAGAARPGHAAIEARPQDTADERRPAPGGFPDSAKGEVHG